ncbi:MAG: hypothetical protein J3R72DRAFT_181377 [Linnemannia gamsii]|nr:MAG: hypothetical protein J3R72DRAFT_181377 [Linnemannia gamsii]
MSSFFLDVANQERSCRGREGVDLHTQVTWRRIKLRGFFSLPPLSSLPYSFLSTCIICAPHSHTLSSSPSPMLCLFLCHHSHVLSSLPWPPLPHLVFYPPLRHRFCFPSLTLVVLFSFHPRISFSLLSFHSSSHLASLASFFNFFSFDLRNTVTDNQMSLLCLVNGLPTSRTLPTKILPWTNIHPLSTTSPWTSLPSGASGSQSRRMTTKSPIVLNTVTDKDRKRLGPATRLSKMFLKELLEKTVHVIVRRPSTTPLYHANEQTASLWQKVTCV